MRSLTGVDHTWSVEFAIPRFPRLPRRHLRAADAATESQKPNWVADR